MICSIALLLILATSAIAGVTKRAPSREQPHVVLESRSINTNEASAFHEDARFKPLAADVVRHEYIVQLKLPVVESKALVGQSPRFVLLPCVGAPSARAIAHVVNERSCFASTSLARSRAARAEAELSVKFGNYMPHNSFFIYATDDVAHALRKHALVLWVGAWLPEYKASAANAAVASAHRLLCGWAVRAQIASVLAEDDVHVQLQHDLYRFVVHYAGDADSAVVVESFQRRLAEQTPAGVDIVKLEAIPSSTCVAIGSLSVEQKQMTRCSTVTSFTSSLRRTAMIMRAALQPTLPCSPKCITLSRSVCHSRRRQSSRYSTPTPPQVRFSITTSRSPRSICLIRLARRRSRRRSRAPALRLASVRWTFRRAIRRFLCQLWRAVDQGINTASCLFTDKIINTGAAPDNHGTAIAAVRPHPALCLFL